MAPLPGTEAVQALLDITTSGSTCSMCLFEILLLNKGLSSLIASVGRGPENFPGQTAAESSVSCRLWPWCQLEEGGPSGRKPGSSEKLAVGKLAGTGSFGNSHRVSVAQRALLAQKQVGGASQQGKRVTDLITV